MSIFIHHGHSSLEIVADNENKIDGADLSTLLEQLKSTDRSVHLQVKTDSPETMMHESLHGFVRLEAAGGLIENPAGEILLIFRRGAWDLPKGKIDPGETPLTAAIREIEEETGLSQLTVLENLSPTYHIYNWKADWVLKKTHWFRFRLNATQPLILQAEEDIEDAEWVKKEELDQYWNRIYPSLHPLIRSATG